MSNQFIHLNLHTEFSLVDGIVRLKPLLKAVQEAEMPAIAITDQSNFYALVKFYQACLGAGIKPLLGVDLWLHNEEKPAKPFRLLLLCKNNEGYLNLKKLISRSYLTGQHLGKAIIKPDWLSDYAAGLIALLGKESDVGQLLLEDKDVEAEQSLIFYQQLFPDNLYVEIQRTSRAGDEKYLHQAVKLTAQLKLPVVATNAVRFLKKEEFSAHDARVCVNQGRILADKKRPHDFSEEQYFKSADEMSELFDDIPEALENSVEIAKRCNVTLHLGENFLPDFPIPEGLSMDEYFRQLSHQGLDKRFPQLFNSTDYENNPDYQEKIKVYRERLDIELDVITQMGFPGYFLIVADFIHWSKENHVPVGPGRGSGAGSLVAYAMTITDLDPLEYDLLFERFLNPERVSMPDFDIDFCMEGREKVIQYVSETYGRDRVSQIITFGSMAAKAAIRDVGRVQGQGYGFVDSLAKLIPMDIGITISKAMQQEEELQRRYDNDDAVRDLIDMALALEGITKNVGKHAGGVVISPSDINDFSPVYCEQDSQSIVTQYDKNDVETVGLVKFDFLGLKTLTVIDWALEIINTRKKKSAEAEIDIAGIDLEDRPSFDTLKASNTTAVFQLESRGMKDLIKRLQPDCFEDIVALVALFRPGPLQSGMVDDFIDRKHGRQKVEYPHPSLEPILQPTYGTILYQEQVMQISQVLAGYTLGGADLLRRAMGKKKPEVMAAQRSIFEEGSVENGVDKDVARHIFDQMEKFAAYGFNKTVDSNTEIYTINGIKKIKDCCAGDQLLSMAVDGTIQATTVLALHDHGKVPLWEIQFDDSTKERCTLDHKWLTESGQQPLWKIIQMGGQVWGCSTNKTRHTCTSETMPSVYEHDNDGAICGQGTQDVLWSRRTNKEKSQRTFSKLSQMSGVTQENSGKQLQATCTYTRNAQEVLTNSKENICSLRYTKGASTTSEVLAGYSSRRVSKHSGKGSCFTENFENGMLVGTLSENAGFYTQYSTSLPDRTETNRLCEPGEKNCYRSRWTLAFSANQDKGISTESTETGSNAEQRNFETFLAINPAFNAVLQRQLWGTYLSRNKSDCSDYRRWKLGRDTVLRKPVRATFVGWHQGYDIEVDHPEHNFLLASGLCCSNSHSAAYALVSYQTLWLKTHFVEAFMAAVLSADMDNTDKVVVVIEECRDAGLKVVAPNVNLSDYKFTVNDDNEIVYGLGAIKGVGEGAIESIVESRSSGGIYNDFQEFCNRVDLRRCNKRVMETLVKAGALDDFGLTRSTLLNAIPEATKAADQFSKAHDAGQDDLFGGDFFNTGAMDSTGDNASNAFKAIAEWPEDQRLRAEKETLGLYLTGHPIDQFLDELRNFTTHRLMELNPDKKQNIVIAGLIIAMRTMITKRGDKMAFITIDDRSGRQEVALFSDTYEDYQNLLIKDSIIVIAAELGLDHYSGNARVNVKTIYDLDGARNHFAKRLNINLHHKQINEDFIAQFKEVLIPFQEGGECPIVINYQGETAQTVISFPADWRVKLTRELLHRIDQLTQSSCRIKYR